MMHPTARDLARAETAARKAAEAHREKGRARDEARARRDAAIVAALADATPYDIAHQFGLTAQRIYMIARRRNGAPAR